MERESVLALCMNEELATKYLKSVNEPKYRTKQLVQWLFVKHQFAIDAMSDLPASFRDHLAALPCVLPLKIGSALEEAETGTRKYLMDTEDGYNIETVLLDDSGRKTLCVSTQIGCPIGCSFCATGKAGYVRNLTAEEIVSQFLIAESDISPEKLDNLVFMGMGEPFLNFTEVARAIAALCTLRVYSQRRITISTVGFGNFGKQLAELGYDIKLSMSLHSTDASIRKTLMPNAPPLDHIMKQYAVYQTTKNRITLEYILIEGMTDRDSDIDGLCAIAKKLGAFVNLIQYNEVPGISYKASKREKQFSAALNAAGIETSIRYRRGRSIKAACGQLIWEKMKKSGS